VFDDGVIAIFFVLVEVMRVTWEREDAQEASLQLRAAANSSSAQGIMMK
jgi:hypothetical protein